MKRRRKEPRTEDRPKQSVTDSGPKIRGETNEMPRASKMNERNEANKELNKQRSMSKLKAFRGVIDGRRESKPDEQPLNLKDFQIGLQIGQGAFAVVRRAQHKDTKHVIAIKTYDKKNLMTEAAANAVHREIETLTDLWHPNLMKLHEVID